MMHSIQTQNLNPNTTQESVQNKTFTKSKHHPRIFKLCIIRKHSNEGKTDYCVKMEANPNTILVTDSELLELIILSFICTLFAPFLGILTGGTQVSSNNVHIFV